MREDITSRFETLLLEGRRLEGMLERDRYGYSDMAPSIHLVQFQAWLTSVANLLEIVTLPGSPFRAEVARCLEHEWMKVGVPTGPFLKLLGILTSAKVEWDAGLLRKIEYLVAAETFDNFLDHAAGYHRGNKKVEAAVLASAVFEDAVKRVAKKNGTAASGKALEELIDDLVKAGPLTPVKAKRWKSHAAVRNSALHADWDAFDIKDAGELIAGTREIIDGYL